MKALIKKNKIIRENYKKLELNYYINSALYNSNILSLAKKEQLDKAKPNLVSPSPSLEILPPLGAKGFFVKKSKIEGKISQIRNICVITGRTRAIIQKYKMSRIKFKQNAEAGLIPGIRKL